MPDAVAAVTVVADAVRDATATLRASGSETPRLDAELLLAHARGCDRSRLVVDAREPLSSAERERFAELVARRAAHEPVAYILGRRGFRHIELDVDPRVLIPRPETELLVEVGLTLAQSARVRDVGTGSGAVALALKYERPDLIVSASDISADALAVARANARRLQLDVTFIQGDLLGDGASGTPLDAVLANLPYVATSGPPLPPDVAGYEPTSALFAGEDGLDLVRRLIAETARSPARLLALEIGFDQADAVAALLLAAGFGAVERLRDLAGHERVIVGRR